MLVVTPDLAIVAGLILGSYLICGIPFGLILARLTGNADLRRVGSGNIGTTNALRVAGPAVALGTLLLDALKGTFCILVASHVLAHGADLALAFVGLACLLGHIFTPYLRFHGGKGIATGVGVLFGLYWPLALIHLGIFFVLVLISHRVSVGSIATAAAIPITFYIFLPSMPATALIIWSCMGLLVVWAHRANISRLLSGDEPALSFKRRGSAQNRRGETQ
ncbi:glycerol-3-phosphate 1-O-acyltransferase PlsY [Collinsella sp. AGMB00827]|uniref:Glycerol-3-phosphate acyltransferase n=1 Tax=Collinsella ureilytica TaxID=2869515 RepID=A0ABS7MKX4_9ACTN|nr:glycerol-3-phosphate 1-O-acyltransferase PlsY [Collinsella urealyticum]MBY4798015.1 glycerol-3-phosphate 1-O-acyltransferase PlsY [Collinsella urealyticum]